MGSILKDTEINKMHELRIDESIDTELSYGSTSNEDTTYLASSSISNNSSNSIQTNIEENAIYTKGEIFYALHHLGSGQYNILPFIEINNIPVPNFIQPYIAFLQEIKIPLVIPIKTESGQWAALVLKLLKSKNNNSIVYYADPNGIKISKDLNSGIYTVMDYTPETTLFANQNQNYISSIAVLYIYHLTQLDDENNIQKKLKDLYSLDKEVRCLKKNLLFYTEQIKSYNNRSTNEIATRFAHNIVNDLFGNNSIFTPLRLTKTQHPNKRNTIESEKSGFIEKRISALGIIARACSSVPYTSVIECADKNNAPLDELPLYISVSDDTKISLTDDPDDLDKKIASSRDMHETENSRLKEFIIKIVSSLVEVLDDLDDLDKKIALFRAMHKIGNSSLKEFIIKCETPSKKVIKTEKYREKLKKLFEQQYSVDEEHRTKIENFIKDCCDQIFPEVSLENKLDDAFINSEVESLVTMIEQIKKGKDNDLAVLLDEHFTENVQLDLVVESEIVATYIKNLEACLDEQTPADKYDITNFREFVDNAFKKMFPKESLANLKEQEDLRRKLKDPKCLRLVYKPHNGVAHGMHVEMQGIAEARQCHPKVTNFNVGLANSSYQDNESKFKEEFACSSCTAEINVLAKMGIHVNIKGTSTNNFPTGKYNPSWNVTKCSEDFLAYLNIVREYISQNFYEYQKEAKHHKYHMLKNSIFILSSLQAEFNDSKLLEYLQQIHLFCIAKATLTGDNVRSASLNAFIQILDNESITEEVFKQYITQISLSAQNSQEELLEKLVTELHKFNHFLKNKKLSSLLGTQHDINTLYLQIRYQQRSIQENLKNTEKIYLAKYTSNKFGLIETLKIVNHERKQILEELAIPSKAKQPKSNQEVFTAVKWKVGNITLFPETDHITEHQNNILTLIHQIREGNIKKDTIIYLERKEEGINLGMHDIISLANIINYNANRNDLAEIVIPQFITLLPIYYDAILYNIAREYGIRVNGIEGKKLKNNKRVNINAYNEEREYIMAEQIKQIITDGQNIIFIVGEAHIKGITSQIVESINSDRNIFNRVLAQLETRTIQRLV